MKKSVIAAVVAVLVIGGASIAGWKHFSGGTGAASESAVPVIAVSSFSGSGAATANRFNGIVETQKKKNITLDTEQSLKEILVAEGDEVLEGDALFTYDTQKTELDIEQKNLEKEKLNSSIKTANEQIAQLNEQLNKGNLNSADRMTVNAQIMETQTSIAQAEYDLKAADAEIGRLKASIKNSTVRSPMTGTIEEITDPETIYDSQTAFIKIVAEGDFRIKGTLSEQSIGMVYEGAPMLVRSRLDSEQTWLGEVTSIETSQNEDNQDVYYGNDSGDRASKYSFYVSLESMEGLMLGQHVTLEVKQGDMSGLVIPMGYVFEEDGKTYVWAVSKPGDKLEKRAVETGESYEDQGMLQITAGLSDMDYIAWPDNADCVEGAATTTEIFSEDVMDGTDMDNMMVDEEVTYEESSEEVTDGAEEMIVKE